MISGCRVLGGLVIALIAGCSGYGQAEYFEVVNDGTLVRFQIHDWYEEETTGPSIGVYAPPVYGFEKAGQLYAIYPISIGTVIALVGPPIVPFIPDAIGKPSEPGGALVLKMRHFPKGHSPVEPVTIRVLETPTTTVTLEKGPTDAVGTIFSAMLPISKTTTRMTVLVTLADNSTRTVELAHRSERLYSPFMSFNGPEPRPSFERYPE